MAQQWSGQTGGTHWMQRALVSIIRHTNIGFVYGLMHLWLIWYIIARPTNTSGAYKFHRHRGRSCIQAAFDVYRSFYHFGKAIIDRFAIYAGESFDVCVENRELFSNCMKQNTGVIMLFSHVGNTEMAGYILSAPEKPMHVIAYGGESPVVMEKRRLALDRNNIDMICVQPNDLSHIYRISEVLQKGDILAMAADRLMGESTTSCLFMGEMAKFPAGAFRICQTTNLPIILFFVIKEDIRKYHVYCETLQPCDDLVQQYVSRLEQMAIAHPYQWFNFYDFWRQ